MSQDNDAPNPRDSRPAHDKADQPTGARLSKWMAQAGLCSRREAEDWIADGRVTLDGSVVNHPAVVVDDPTRISVDGKPLKAPEAARLWKMHKPTGVLVTENDPEGRPTIYDLLPKDLPRLLYVGRLDINSEGLLLLTNNGELKRKLELPATGLARTYRVRLRGKPKQSDLDQLEQGLEIDGITYGSIQAEIERSLGANTWMNVTLHEGKNREIRRVFEHLGYEVNRLIRVSYGPITLGTLAARGLREIDRQLLSRYFGLGPKRRSTWARAKTPEGKRLARPTRSEVTGMRDLRDDVKEALQAVEERDAAREEGRRRKAAGLPSLREERSRSFRERHVRKDDERGERREGGRDGGRDGGFRGGPREGGRDGGREGGFRGGPREGGRDGGREGGFRGGPREGGRDGGREGGFRGGPREGGRDGGRDGGFRGGPREGGRDGGRDGGFRSGPREGGRDGGRDGGFRGGPREGGRDGGRDGGFRGGPREGGRDGGRDGGQRNDRPPYRSRRDD